MASRFPETLPLKVEIPNKTTHPDKLFVSYGKDFEQPQEVPSYESVQQLRRSLLSWSCVTLEGFHYCDMYDRSFFPENHCQEWLQHLLTSLFDSGHCKDNSPDPNLKLKDVFKMGCSSIDDIWVKPESGGSVKLYKAGRTLANRMIGKFCSYYELDTVYRHVPEVTQLLAAFNA